MKEKSTKVSIKFLVYLIPVLLVVGTALGAVVWLMDAEVPIQYDDPYTVSLSQSETGDYDWQELQFRETTVTKTAYFNESEPGISYHQYVKVDNPEGTDNLTLEFEVNEPDSFSNEMGFTVLSGIVEPGDEGELGVEEWGSIQDNITVEAGNTENVTVVYTLNNTVPSSNDYDVIWNFYEGELPDSYTFVSNENELETALSGTTDTIILSDDITYYNGESADNLNDRLSIERGVTIDGNGHEITVVPHDQAKGVPAITVAETNDEDVLIENLKVTRDSKSTGSFYQGIAIYSDNVTVSDTLVTDLLDDDSDAAGIWIGTGSYDPYSSEINNVVDDVGTLTFDDYTRNNIDGFTYSDDPVVYDGDDAYWLEDYPGGDPIFST